MSINQVFLTGNLTRDPELRTTAAGLSVLSFGLAVNDRHRNQQTGEWEDYANFIDCVLFGKRAEHLVEILSKGFKVALSGKLRWSQWERGGQKRSKIQVVVNDLDFVHPRKDSDEAVSTAEPESSPESSEAASVYDSDIPF